MTSEVEERPRLVTGGTGVNGLMSSLQVLQNKAAKIILDQPLYSSASHAPATLKWIPLEKKGFPAKMCACLQMSK